MGAEILSDVNFAIPPQSFQFLTGPSGAGKTTLLRMIAGLDTPDSGQLLLNGHAITKPGPDRAMGERLHAIIKASAPALSPKTWYGMPAYAKDGKVVCFFQDAKKFKSRYATFGFSDEANLDDGAMWPTTFAPSATCRATQACWQAYASSSVIDGRSSVTRRICRLVRRAVSCIDAMARTAASSSVLTMFDLPRRVAAAG